MKPKLFIIIFLTTFIPLAASAYTYSRLPSDLLLTVWDEIKIVLDGEDISEIYSKFADCRGTLTTHANFRVGSGDAPFIFGEISALPATVTTTFPRGEYDAINLRGFDEQGQLCFNANVEEHVESRLVVITPQCADGIDNDGDGKMDFMEDGSGDPGCDELRDNNENSPPQITLNGDTDITVTLGTEFSDPGAIATDEEDDPDPIATISGDNVDINTAGDYTTRYNASDSNGAAAEEKTRLVRVRPQCSDGVNNDADSVMDEDDAGCHSDHDTQNSNTYDADDNDEFNPPPSNGAPGSTGGGGGGFVLGATSVSPIPSPSPSLTVSSGEPTVESSDTVLGATLTPEDQIALLRAQIAELQEQLKQTLEKYIVELLQELIQLLEKQLQEFSS